MELIRIENESEIYSTIILLSRDMFNQSLNKKSILEELSKKYCQYSNFYICKEKEKTLGYCAFYTNMINCSDCFLSMIVIKKEYRNKGIGTMFINNIVEICKENNICAIKLSVNKKNMNAINFYVKNEFEIIASDEYFYTMRKIVF